MNVTTNELAVLRAVFDSEYQDGNTSREDIVDHSVWASYTNPFKANPKSYGGVIVSLVKKGLVRHFVDPSNANYAAGCDGSTIAITDAGFDVLNPVAPTTGGSTVFHTPAHKQTDPAKQPGQIVNPIPALVAALDKPAAVREALPKFVAAVQSLVDAYFAKSFSNLTSPLIGVDKGGVKYARITSTDRPPNQRFVYCFIDLSNGDILKAAGWKAPAKHARGNILSADLGLSGVTPYGAKYL